MKKAHLIFSILLTLVFLFIMSVPSHSGWWDRFRRRPVQRQNTVIVQAITPQISSLEAGKSATLTVNGSNLQRITSAQVFRKKGRFINKNNPVRTFGVEMMNATQQCRLPQCKLVQLKTGNSEPGEYQVVFKSGNSTVKTMSINVTVPVVTTQTLPRPAPMPRTGTQTMTQTARKGSASISKVQQPARRIVLEQTTEAQQQQRINYFMERERTAPIQIKNQLQKLRQDLITNNVNYTVGYTTAMDMPREILAKTIIPRDFEVPVSQIKKPVSNLSMEKINKLQRLKELGYAGIGYAISFDWRKEYGATPVENQKGCGSCWAFAALDAYEGAYQKCSPVAVNLSEQDVLSCSGTGSCTGGWYNNVFEYMKESGVADEAQYPYTAPPTGICRTDITNKPYKVAAWGWVGADVRRPTVNELKHALTTYGPLAVALDVTHAFYAYTSGVLQENEDSGAYVGMTATTLIGWDNAKQAWLIKHHWGPGWGETGGYGTEGGYMWIAYDSFNIGQYATWVLPVCNQES